MVVDADVECGQEGVEVGRHNPSLSTLRPRLQRLSALPAVRTYSSRASSLASNAARSAGSGVKRFSRFQDAIVSTGSPSAAGRAPARCAAWPTPPQLYDRRSRTHPDVPAMSSCRGWARKAARATSCDSANPSAGVMEDPPSMLARAMTCRWRRTRGLPWPLSACSLIGRRRGCPRPPRRMAGTESRIGPTSMLSCRLAPETATLSGGPGASTGHVVPAAALGPGGGVRPGQLTPSRPDADGVEAGARPVQAVGLAEPVEHRLMEPKAMLLSTSRSEGRGRPVRPWTAGARGGISGSTSAHSSSPIGRGGRGRRRRRHDPDPAPIHLSATEPEDLRPQRLPSPGLVLSRCGSAGRRRCAITS